MPRAGGDRRPTRASGGRRAATRSVPQTPRRAPPRATASGSARGPERLQKVLARAGLASRREVEEWIRAGRLTINGAVATLGARVSPGDQLRLDGRVVHAREAAQARVFLCHRSPGEPLIGPAGAGGASVGTAGARGPGPARPARLERLPRRAGRRFIAV